MNSLLDILVALTILQGLMGVVEGIRYRRYIRAHLNSHPQAWTPFASVFLPCKGLDFELERNVEGLLSQEYPDFEVVFVTATSDDPSIPSLRKVAAAFPQLRTNFVVAGWSNERGEKVNNLIQAVSHADVRSEVFVFTDSDARPRETWLRDLISPLREEQVGVSTGYRWLFPFRGNLASVLCSAWNASVVTVLGNHALNFAWGGSMAIRRTTFEGARVLAHWKHSISDDYSLARAVKKARLKIHYEPRCLIASHGSCGWRELLQWSTRQIIITKVYWRRLWELALVSHFIFVTGWWWVFGQFTLAVWQSLTAGDIPPPMRPDSPLHHYGTIISIIFFLGALRGFLRTEAVKLIQARDRDQIQQFWWAYTLLSPIVSTLTAYNLAVSLLTSSLEWRGVRYELKSADEVRVIRST
jgi:cellulose synthase/poly-beta-1,6-N-acetylglucosamine synthase-like glycosyltransferase